ncbi:MAG: histidinol dehydrogenase [Clostridiales bacterium]|nr:histidinol dehydrogenase [Clostridiales bacterium]MCF8021680.1 histidinol dehydrogenase [Clostridiales bacterium]
MLEILYPGHPTLKVIKNRKTLDRQNAAGTVKGIIENVKDNGDKAVCQYAFELDNVRIEPGSIQVTPEEIEAAFNEVSRDFISALTAAANNIKDHHKKQLRTSWFEAEGNGTILGQLIRPVEKAGVYVPGGTAAYPSSALMNAIPAKVAGVKKIVMVTPPGPGGKINPHTLAAAKEAGVDEIYRVGGAQGVAALAHGTETIPKVDKITGPGNVYVTLAKQQVYGLVDIDMLAGPSEVLVVADENASPQCAAADMLSQAEHDIMSSAVLVTTSQAIAEDTAKELSAQLIQLPRQEVARESLQHYGSIVLVENLEQAVDIANDIAPEHLELMVESPYELLGKIKNAGAVFLGYNSPEPVGDYFAGPNHILPTNGTARFFSPLNVDSFLKKTSVVSYSREKLQEAAPSIIELARVEGFEAHARAIETRIRKKGVFPDE